MALANIQNLNQDNTTSVISTQVVNPSNVTTTSYNIPVASGATGAPEDSYSSNGTNTVTVRTKRTLDELYNAISAICKANGLDINEAKNIGLLESISGKTQEYLLNAEQNEINNIVKDLTSAIEAIKEDIKGIGTEKPLTFHLIKNYNRLPKGEVPKGWDSVESFRKAQRKTRNDGSSNAQSLSERLKAMYGFDIKGKSTEEIATTLEAYFDSYFQSLNGSREQVDNLQLTDFTKLLFNSSPEEYETFRDAIEYLVVNNRDKGYKAILDSFETDAERTDFERKTPEGYVERVLSAPDQRGEVATAEQAAAFIAVHTEYMDEETFEKYHKTSKDGALNFYNEETLKKLEEIKSNPKIIEDIQAKLLKIETIQNAQRKKEKGEELTAEEIDLLENPIELTEEEKSYLEIYAKDRYYRGDSAGQAIGIGINKVIATESKNELLETINIDAYEIGEKAGDDFYKNTLAAIAKYAKSLPEEEREAFKKLMEETLGENYTNIANADDIKSVEITKPVRNTNNNENTVTSEVTGVTTENTNTIGFTLRESPTSTAQPTNLYATTEDNKEDGDPITFNRKDFNRILHGGNLKDIKELPKVLNVGITDFAINILNKSHTLPTIVENWCLEKLYALNNSQKADACNALDMEYAFKIGETMTTEESLRKVKHTNEKAKDFFNQLIEERRELEA